MALNPTLTAVTRAQREQVVELLRCAADQVSKRLMPVRWCHTALNRRDRIYDIALEVRRSVGPIEMSEERYRAQLLEAAARVEEKSWP